MKRILTIVIAILLTCVINPAAAQPWLKHSTDKLYGPIVPTRDGNYVVYARPPLQQPNLMLEKIAPDGSTIWIKTLMDSAVVMDIVETSDGGLAMAVDKYWTDSTSLFNLVLADSAGNLLWVKNYMHNGLRLGQPIRLIQNSDGGFTLIGAMSDSLVGERYIVRTDAAGDTLWTWSDAHNDYYPTGLAHTSDGGFVMSGAFTDTGQMYLNKFDASGSLLWEKIYYTGTYSYRVNVIETPDAGFLLTGTGGEYPYTTGRRPYILKTNATGDSLWSKNVNPGNAEEVVQVLPTPDGGYGLLLAEEGPDIILMKLDAAFDSVWLRTYTVTHQAVSAAYLVSDHGNGFTMAGEFYEPGLLNPPPSGFVFSTDSADVFHMNTVRGHVYKDVIANCSIDPADNLLANRIVQLAGSTASYFDVTDSTGQYEILVDTGRYELMYNDADPYWRLDTCNSDSFIVTFSNGLFDTVSVNMPLTPTVLCPNMHVSITTTLQLRPCLPNNIAVYYSNNGTITASNVVVDVDIDPYLTVTGSSVPWTTPQAGTIYRFAVGSVDPGATGYFYINTLVSCSTEINRTHCVTAHIYPDSTCFAIDPLWDRSSIEVKAGCDQQDSVRFEIHNKGTGDMQVPLQYYIVEDNVMVRSGGFQLAAGQSKLDAVKANGSTWTLIAQQSEYHPGNSLPLISIEGCGTNNQGTFSKGFIMDFPLDDADDFIDIACQIVTTAIDPNDKQVSPEGLTLIGYISATQHLEYKVRFQNTGNDTAFLVVIRDTLSAYLDINTLQLGVSSHSYTFAIRDSNILEWTFPNILLPDSNVNEPASHGFLTFSIDQKATNQPGDVILNSAGIYFDFNAPVITNTTINTIVDDYKQWLAVEEVSDKDNSIHIYPNPTEGQLTIVLEGKPVDNFRMLVYDLAGKQVKEYQLQGAGAHTINDMKLQQGMYLFEVVNGGEKVGAGKLMVY